MNRIIYQVKCKCNEEISITKKRKATNRGEGKPFLYPTSPELGSETFHLKYTNKLSSQAKLILYSLQKKYFYYAIDDISYILKSNLIERNNLLNLLYAPIISLQNNFSINFFDIWINEIRINEVKKSNKFLNQENLNLESYYYITIKFLYKTKIPTKKQQSLW